MPGICLLDRIERKRADGVDAELVDVGCFFKLGRRCHFHWFALKFDREGGKYIGLYRRLSFSIAAGKFGRTRVRKKFVCSVSSLRFLVVKKVDLNHGGPKLTTLPHAKNEAERLPRKMMTSLNRLCYSIVEHFCSPATI